MKKILKNIGCGLLILILGVAAIFGLGYIIHKTVQMLGNEVFLYLCLTILLLVISFFIGSMYDLNQKIKNDKVI